MEKYLEEAIKKGTAYNSQKNPEISRKFLEENLGYMRDIFTNVDEFIDEWVIAIQKEEVVNYADLKTTIYGIVAENLPNYFKLTILKFKAELNELKLKEQHDTQTN